MKKGMGLKLGAIILALSLFGCSSDLMEDKSLNVSSGDNQNYGTLVVTNSDRSLDVNTIKNAKVTVSSSDMTDISVDSEVKNGSGTFFFEKIPVGDNRVVTVQAVDENGKNISGWTMRNVIDIKAGSNTVVVDWNSTGLGNVYSELLAKGEKIANYTDAQDSSIKNAVPSASGYYVDSAAIANDFKNSSLKSSASYKMTAAKLTYKSAGATGYKITVLDPTSANKTIASESTGSVENIAPGKWKVIVTDGTKDVVNKTMTFTNAGTTELGTLGDPLNGKVIVFIKGAEAIWAWEKEGSSEGVPLSEKLGGKWGSIGNGTKLSPATNDYMNDPNGWGMIDFTSVSSGKAISFKLNWSDPERNSGKPGTFWFDGSEFYDTDPTANQLSKDATLASITVNGVVVEGFDTSKDSFLHMIESNVTSADVRASATHENATVEISPEFKTEIEAGSSREFVITVTAEDGKTTKSYTVTVRRKVENDTSLVSVTVNGKPAKSSENGSVWTYDVSGTEDTFTIETIKATALENSSVVTIAEQEGSVSDGGTFTTKITVKNGTKTTDYTLNVNYAKKDQPVGKYYWTNKGGAVGTNKTIKSWSDWSESEKIVQGAANDDPRVFCQWSMHEPQTDAYALYAAYDDTHLYLMVELTNVQDVVAPQDTYPISDNGQFWNRGTPFFMAFETGKGVGGDGSMVAGADPYVWNSAVKFANKNVDTMFVCHSNPEKGKPGVFYTDSQGLFSYADSLCKTFPGTSVEVSWDGGPQKTQGIVSKEIWGIKEVGTGQGRTIEGITNEESYVDFNTLGHDKNQDLKWQMKIPLATLKVDKSYIESNGIGVMFVLSDGASGMDCLPWDAAMVDNAAKPYSKDKSTSAEKEDEDIITTPFARIGAM